MTQYLYMSSCRLILVVCILALVVIECSSPVRGENLMRYASFSRITTSLASGGCTGNRMFLGTWYSSTLYNRTVAPVLPSICVHKYYRYKYLCKQTL